MKHSSISQKIKAFTLIELLIVIAVIGILVAVILPNLVTMRERARDVKRKNDLAQLRSALRMYFNDYNSYPPSNNQQICCSLPSEPCQLCADNVFIVNGLIYIKDVPENYSYELRNGGQGFLLTTMLENASDNDLVTSAARCQIASPTPQVFYICED